MTPTSDGSAAVREYRDARETRRPFDAAILDLTVPGGMGGEEAAEEILRIDPAARVLLASGYAARAGSVFAAGGCRDVIAKPFSMRALAEKIEGLLAGS